jgi:glycosyltransferase involved in cell wall biosynthesis
MAAEQPVDRRDAAALPRISVVVPSYNQALFLPECLESIFRQDYPHLEVVVMDGGSTDGSVDIIRSFAPRLKHWQSQRDGGQSAAINAGMQHTTGDLVAWLNSDDFYWQDALWVMARAWMQHPGRGLYIANGFRYEQATDTRYPFLHRHIALNRRGLLEGSDYILQPATFFWREAFQAVGGLDPKLRFCMDWDIFLRITQRYAAVAINEFVAVSREYEDTKTRSGGMVRVNEILRMIHSHCGKEFTPGTLCYVLDTAMAASRGEISAEATEKLGDGLIRVMCDFSADFGDGTWAAAYADPQDVTYLPLAQGPRVRRARPAGTAPLPRISVIVLVEGDSTGFDETLASITGQDYRDLEILIIDGDGTLPAQCDTIPAGACILRPRRARGPAALLNQALAVAQGEVLTWLPAGDLLADGALQEAGAAFADDPELDLVYGNALFLDPQGQPCVVDLKPMRTCFWIGRFEPPEIQPGYDDVPYAVPQSSVCFRRRAWEQTGPLNESYRQLHGYDWFLRLAAHGRLRKLERTQAFCRIGLRDEPHRWHETLVELYRLSRPDWPRPDSPEYRRALKVFSDHFLRHKFGVMLKDDPNSWVASFVRLVVHLRLFNPERFWPRGFIVPPRGAPPFHVPLPGFTIRRAMPLRNSDDLLPREGAAYHAVVCLPRPPHHAGVVGTEARESHLLAEVYRNCLVELFTFRSSDSPPSAVTADAVYTPDQPARFRLDQLWRGLPPRSLPLRLIDTLRSFRIPVVGPANPLNVSRQFVRVRGYCALPIQDRLERPRHRPEFLFVGDQANPAALALDTSNTTTRLVLIAHELEAERLERQAASSRGLSRLAASLEARRGQRFEAANLAQYDGVIAASAAERELLASRYGFPSHRVLVTGRTVDAEWWSACRHAPASPAIVGFLGDLDDPQDAGAATRLARRILPLLQKQIPEAACWIIDVGRHAGKRRSHLGAARVIAAGEDARPHLGQASVVCLPHFAGRPAHSAAPEALAAGVPLVTTPAAAEGLAIEAGTHYMAAIADHELAAAITGLLRTPQSAAALARAGQEQVLRHHAVSVQLAGFRAWLDQLAQLPRRRDDSGAAPQGVCLPAAAAERAA